LQHRRDAVAAVARNEPSENALVYCCAVLRAEPGNAADPDAVAVLVEDRQVGYVPREVAPAVARWLAAHNDAYGVLVDAVISRGSVLPDGRVMRYEMAIDLPNGVEPQKTPPRWPIPVRRNGHIRLSLAADGGYAGEVWLPPLHDEVLHPDGLADIYPPPDGGPVIAFAVTKRKLGRYFIGTVPREDWVSRYGSTRSAQLIDVMGRSATIRFDPK
jgi:hypothetical protein